MCMVCISNGYATPRSKAVPRFNELRGRRIRRVRVSTEGPHQRHQLKLLERHCGSFHWRNHQGGFESSTRLLPRAHKGAMAEHPQHHDTSELVDACLSTQKLCMQAVSLCLVAGGNLAQKNVINSLLDCAESNGATASFLARASRQSVDIVKFNSRISSHCADTIGSFDDQAGQLRSVYAACLQVADASLGFGDSERKKEERQRDKMVADSFPASDPPSHPSAI